MQEKIASTYTYVADGSMKNAANEFIPKQGQGNKNIADNIADITVSNDKSWQKCDHSSLNGVITVVASDSGKCVDFRVLTKTCKACTSWEKRKNSEPELYKQFMETHDCPINHEGSAGSMEAAGLVDCFMNSMNSLRTQRKGFADIIEEK